MREWPRGDRFLIAEKCSSGNREVGADNLVGLSQFSRGVNQGWWLRYRGDGRRRCRSERAFESLNRRKIARQRNINAIATAHLRPKYFRGTEIRK